MKTIYNPLMRLFDALILFIMSVGAFIFMVFDIKSSYEIFGLADLIAFYLAICFFAIPMFIGAVFIYKRLSIYVKTDGKKFYAYRYPNVLLCEVDLSKPVYYKFEKIGHYSKYIVFSNENFEFRELSKTTTTFWSRIDIKKIILVRYDTSVTHYFPLFDWTEVEDRTGMLPKKQEGNTEHIILKFPKFTKTIFVVFPLIALVYMPIVMPFYIPLFVLLGVIVFLCLTGLLYCLLWKIEFFDNDDFFIYSSIFAGRKKKIYFSDCEKIVWSKNPLTSRKLTFSDSGETVWSDDPWIFRIVTVEGKKILVLSLVSNYEMLRRKLLQNGVEEEKHQNKG